MLAAFAKLYEPTWERLETEIANWLNLDAQRRLEVLSILGNVRFADAAHLNKALDRCREIDCAAGVQVLLQTCERQKFSADIAG